MNADTATGDCNPLPTRDRRPVHSLQQRSRAWQKALDRRQRQRLNKYAYNSGTYPWPVHNEQQPLHTCSSGDGERKDWNALWSRHVDTNEDNLQDNKEKKTNIKNENHNGATWSMLHDLGHALVVELIRSGDGVAEMNFNRRTLTITPYDQKNLERDASAASAGQSHPNEEMSQLLPADILKDTSGAKNAQGEQESTVVQLLSADILDDISGTKTAQSLETYSQSIERSEKPRQ